MEMELELAIRGNPIRLRSSARIPQLQEEELLVLVETAWDPTHQLCPRARKCKS